MKQLMFHDDPAFWFETLRNLGLAAYGGPDVGEVIATASRVTPGDYDGWHDAWLATAERLETEARASHPISARDGLLRAASYYRAAEFFLHGNPHDPRIDTQDPGVDPARIALLGVSLGDYLAPRAAAYEPRLAAVGALTAQLPLPHDEAVRRAAEHDEEMDRMIADARAQPDPAQGLRPRPVRHRTAYDREFLAEYARYSFEDGSARKITCPVLVCEATGDLYYSATEESDPRKLYRHLTAPKTLLSFTEAEGADAHCHPGAFRLAVARVFDWLDDTI